MKKCQLCKLEKDEENFYFSTRGKKMNRCKECHKAYDKCRYLAHTKRYKAQAQILSGK